jgi:MFS family permease
MSRGWLARALPFVITRAESGLADEGLSVRGAGQDDNGSAFQGSTHAGSPSQGVPLPEPNTLDKAKLAAVDAARHPVRTVTQAASLAARSFHPISVPASSRRNYARELKYSFLFPATLTIVEGGIIAIITRQAFDGVVSARVLDLFIAVLAAAPEFGNLTSFLWSRLAHGRDKIRFINGLQWATVVLVAIISIIPKTPAGLVMLVMTAVAARMCIAGVMTLRAGVWRANYSRAERTRATGKFSTIQVQVIALVGFLIGQLLDLGVRQAWSIDAFRVVVPVCAILGALGAAYYGRIRVRGHAAMLNQERQTPARDRPSLNPISLAKLLVQDRAYGWFMFSMFLLGLGNLMLMAPLIIVLKERFGFGYGGGITLAATVPLMLMPVFIPVWTRLLSRVHVVRFRSIHSWSFVIGQGLVMLAVLWHSVPILVLSGVFMGMGYAGGSLAWNLGHLDFAPSHKATLYMGVHVTLNGLRGVMAPFISTGLYRWLESTGPGRGAWVFGFSVILCAAGGLGFWLLGRSMGERVKHAPRDG